LAEAGSDTSAKALIPGTYLVDTFPILKYVPSWIPGAGFKRHALECRKQLVSMLETPFAEMKRRMVGGIFFVFFSGVLSCLSNF
jgi:hypothetical protein